VEIYYWKGKARSPEFTWRAKHIAVYISSVAQTNWENEMKMGYWRTAKLNFFLSIYFGSNYPYAVWQNKKSCRFVEYKWVSIDFIEFFDKTYLFLTGQEKIMKFDNQIHSNRLTSVIVLRLVRYEKNNKHRANIRLTTRRYMNTIYLYYFDGISYIIHVSRRNKCCNIKTSGSSLYYNVLILNLSLLNSSLFSKWIREKVTNTVTS